jgi:glycogen phosphorylase
MRVPIVAVSLLHRAGHFAQKLDSSGAQSELPVDWNVSDFLTEMPVRAVIQIEGRSVSLRCWKYQVEGVTGYSVPVYLLDTGLPENSEWDRRLTSILYGGEAHCLTQPPKQPDL